MSAIKPRHYPQLCEKLHTEALATIEAAKPHFRGLPPELQDALMGLGIAVHDRPRS